MATYKFSGGMRDARDNQLWKEMLSKETFIQNEHKKISNSRFFGGEGSRSKGSRSV